MLQAYSNNIQGTANSAIPFNNVKVEKGCSARLTAPSTIQLNKAGVYMVACDASFTPDAAGVSSIQLSRNGVLQPDAQSSETGIANSTNALSFYALVQVRENNTCSCCSSPTTLQVIQGIDGTFENVNICVTKIC